ncbi:MAG: hypothetical protein ACLQG5_03950 [Methanobacterium sp.]|jgi:uncharacterized protein YneF (UPF0154 family)
MSKELTETLLKAYHRWLSDPNPPVPIPEIKEFLENEGINLNENQIQQV